MKLKKHKFKIYLFPRVKIKFSQKYKIYLLNEIIGSNLNYLSFSTQNDFAVIEIYSNKIKDFKDAFERLGINYQIESEYGLFSVFKRNKHRIGLLVGAILLIIVSFFSSKFVWKININGNSTLSREEVLDAVNRSGLDLGTYIPSIDYDRLHNKILLCNDKISWISVNIKGNIANIEIKETEGVKDEKAFYTNVVSKCDAQIISIEAINGEKKIQAGDIVKAGELLISGVIDSQASGVRYENAKGSVLAYVNKKIYIEIPRTEYENVAVKKVHTDRSIKIFSNIIKISLKHSNCGDFCGKIEKKDDIVLFGKHHLPVSVIKTEHFLIEQKEIIHTSQEMVDLAFAKLNEKINIDLTDAQLISKSVNTYYQNEKLILECDLYCIEDIAKEVQIFVEN